MRGLLGELIAKQFDFTVVDMEAGLEHLSRSGGTLRHVDALLVVVEAYRNALETARRTQALAGELGIPQVLAVANKVRDAGEAGEIEAFASGLGMPIVATVPYDEAVREADRAGAAVIDAAVDGRALRAIDGLLETLLRAPATA